jgi:hypothetical protein
MTEEPSKLLVMQRIRNRIFEYLEGVLEYESDPGAWDLNELVNEWEMWVEHTFQKNDFAPPAFTPSEADALALVHLAWLAFADATPNPIRNEMEALSTND